MLQPKRRSKDYLIPTRQDSIDVKEDSKRLLKEYTDRGYEPTDVKFPDETLDESLKRIKGRRDKTELIRDNKRRTETYDANEFRQPVNLNQYRQRESANGVLNMDIKPALYDMRIKPVGRVNLMGTKGGTRNDGVSIPSYADLVISKDPNETVAPKIEKKASIITPVTKKVQPPTVEAKKAAPAKVIKPTSKTGKYRETLEPQADTLSKQTLGVNRIRANSLRAIKTLNIVKPKK